MTSVLSPSSLNEAVAGWISEGKRVAGPVRMSNGRIQYAWIHHADELEWDDSARPVNSIKAFVFPPHEVLFAFEKHGRAVQLRSHEVEAPDQIILAARPCDAAALPLIDCVFNWDSKDAFYNRRRQRTTVVTLACRSFDQHCFCTSVRLSPEDTRGSDAMLVALDEGGWEVRFVTEKGRQLLASRTTDSDRTGRATEGPAPCMDLHAIEQFLAKNFDDPLWSTAALRCLGCGACAHNCPACHCFDIVDRGNQKRGQRVRNWDSCQSAIYSAHASGHNPRSDQAARQRNRLMHKFRVFPEKFGDVLCTGCGNCTRNCPVSLGVQGVLQQMVERQSAPAKEAVS